MLTPRLTSIICGLLAVTMNAQAQDSLLLRDYRFVKQADAWLTAYNAAALVRFHADDIAEANLGLTKGNGHLTDFNGSPDDLTLRAGIEAFRRLSPRTVVFGAMSYDNHSGNDMAGSAFMPAVAPSTPNMYATLSSQPHLPFDIVEDSLNNLGRKHRDVYHLTGAVGTDLWRGMAIGLRADYTAANYAKYKDLRHQNKLMDMRLTASIYAPLAPWLQLGAYYRYHRNTESLTFSTYGKSDRVYQSLISYAAFMGPLEQFGTNGYTDRSRSMPLVSDYHGLGLQLCLTTQTLSFYNSFDYAHRHGYYGRKSPYTITYATHRSDVYEYVARLALQTRQSRHHLDLRLQAENLVNDGANYRELINDAGASYYAYLTPTKTANRLWVEGTVALTSDLDIHGETPTWTLRAGLDWQHRKQTAYVYPYYRRQRLTTREPFLTATRRLATRSGVWSATLDARFRHGTGEPCEDQTFAAPSDKQTAPTSMDAYLMREYRWLTAPQYQVGGAVRYAFILPGTHIRLHAEAAMAHRKANVSYDLCEGRDRTTGTLTIGCTF